MDVKRLVQSKKIFNRIVWQLDCNTATFMVIIAVAILLEDLNVQIFHSSVHDNSNNCLIPGSDHTSFDLCKSHETLPIFSIGWTGKGRRIACPCSTWACRQLGGRPAPLRPRPPQPRPLQARPPPPACRSGTKGAFSIASPSRSAMAPFSRRDRYNLDTPEFWQKNWKCSFQDGGKLKKWGKKRMPITFA